MEETKYYTPTIEEFHVGFEFDYLDSKNIYGIILKCTLEGLLLEM